MGDDDSGGNPSGGSRLVVTLAGDGAGRVTSTPVGIECGTDCEEQFPAGTLVTMHAVTDPGSSFAGWQGACAGTGACTIDPTAATSVTARFELLPNVLRVGIQGPGVVRSVPAGIDCSTDCVAEFAPGTRVTLMPTPAANHRFVQWTGACSGTGACTLDLDQGVFVTAMFEPIVHTLTVVTGGGSLTISPTNTVCDAASCQLDLPEGTQIAIAASPMVGYELSAWSGGCTGNQDCELVLVEDTTITASFVRATRTLTLDFVGTSAGTVRVSPGNHVRSGDGALVLPTGTITLEAVPSPGNGFAGWSGPCSGFDECTIDLQTDTTVTAGFDPPNRMFVTSTTVAPAGTNTFNSACRNAAINAGLTGTFVPVVGTTGVLSNARGWSRLDGLPFADTAADVAAYRMFYPGNLTETGAFTTTAVITGGAGVYTCSGWTSSFSGDYYTTGEPGAQDQDWWIGGARACSQPAALYCFETARKVRLRPTPPNAPFRRAFVTATRVRGDVTLAGADATCQAEAGAAGLPGTYVALLASGTASALSRLDTTSDVWYRPDHVRLASHFELSGALDAALNMTATGERITLDGDVWVGGSSIFDSGSTTSCSGWTTTQGNGRAGTVQNYGNTWFGGWLDECFLQKRLFCFQT